MTWSSRIAGLALSLTLFLALAQCGGGQPRGREEAPPPVVARPAVESRVPLLRWVPEDAELVFKLPSLRELASKGKALALAFAFAEPEQAGELSHWLELPGMDTKREGVAFVWKGSLVIMYPILDTAAYDDAAGKHALPRIPSLSIASARSEDRAILLASRGNQELAALKEQLLSAMRSAGQGTSFSANPMVETSVDQARTEDSWITLGDALVSQVASELSSRLGCLALVPELGIPYGSVSLDAGRVDLRFRLPLKEGLASGLKEALGPGPSRGMEGLRGEHPMALSIALKLPSLANWLETKDCEKSAATIQQLYAGSPISPPPTAIHIAGTRFDSSDLSGNLAAVLHAADTSFLRNALDEIPGRSLFEKTLREGSVRYKKIDAPLMSALYYQLGESRVIFSTHKAHMVRLLPEDAPVGELFFVHLVPGKISQKTKILKALFTEVELRDQVSSFLERFSQITLGIRLEGGELVVEVGLVPALTP